MSLITRRNWPRCLSIALIVCVLLYVCAHSKSWSYWMENASCNCGGANVVVNSGQRTGESSISYTRTKQTKETIKRTKKHDQKDDASRGEKSQYGKKTNENGDNKPETESPGSEQVKRDNKTVRTRHDHESQESKSPTIGIYSLDRQDFPVRVLKSIINHILSPESVGNHCWAKNAFINGPRLATSAGPREPTILEIFHHLKTTLSGTMTKASVSGIMTARDAISCNQISSQPRIAQRGDYWVLYNYVPMSIRVKCWETVTFATHAEYTFLDNLVPLLERWRAPISIAMHAPGTDFQLTLNSIKYARNCASPLVSQLVTFHIYFSNKHIPKLVPRSEKIVSDNYNCSLGRPWANVVPAKMYKNENKLFYPINVGRNIAREFAPTYYVLVSDIELYPSPNLPSEFLGMLARADQSVLLKPNPKVFVLPVFEVAAKSTPPSNKTSLMKMLKNGSAIPFHHRVCQFCHNIPGGEKWRETPQSDKLRVFGVGKRTGKFKFWEPVFIGTNADPMHDERLSWEGKRNKMAQGYALCALDYDFLILDNAFLVHRPGIMMFPRFHNETAKTDTLIDNVIFPELKVMFGRRNGCHV